MASVGKHSEQLHESDVADEHLGCNTMYILQMTSNYLDN
jgi:hypothetical protein